MRQATTSDGGRIDFEIFGESGPFVFLGPPMLLTSPLPEMEQQFRELLHGCVDPLRNRYRVIVADWPRGYGGSSPADGPKGHKDQAIRDIHAIADAAGAERFAWWGYSYGTAIGLQLARNNPRISALVCGGFPPLWQPLSDLLNAVRATARAEGTQDLPELATRLRGFAETNRQFVAFYESVAGQDDREAIREITCPSMVFHDVADTVEMFGIKVDLSMRTRAMEDVLKKMGWGVAWLDTGLGHGAMSNAKACVDAVSPFLDRVLL